MEFRLDHPKFESLTAAFDHILDEYAEKEHPVYPGQLPAFIFRGECGSYPSTKPSIARVHSLSAADLLKLAEISDWVAAQLHAEREDLTWPQACAQLQHYGMPSRIVDFTGDLGTAFAYAGSGAKSVGRLAVLPYVRSQTGPIFEFFDHPWAERAQRQAAYGVLMDPHEISDLKCDGVRDRLNLRWYEFEILQKEREFCQERAGELLQETNDASGGFVRYYVTRYVEAFKKLSPPLADWLVKNVAIAPYCALVASHEEKEAVVYFRSAECLATANLRSFHRGVEVEWSRRYWSEAYADDSRERVHNFVMPSPGQMFVDPRTYHPESDDTSAQILLKRVG
jgi:hypothetical protein